MVRALKAKSVRVRHIIWTAVLLDIVVAKLKQERLFSLFVSVQGRKC